MISSDNKQKFVRPWYLTMMILFMVPMTGIGIDLYAPSLPWIVSALHTSAYLVKLTIAVYFFGYAVGPLLAGTLSDVYGRKPTLIIGMALYIAVCLLIIIVPNINMMLAMRFLQGVAAAFLAVTYRTVFSDAYTPGIDMKKMGASISLAWSLGPILAPFVGGYLQHYFGWQSNFIFYIVYASIVLCMAFVLPETNRHPVKCDVKKVTRQYRDILSTPMFWGCVMSMGIVYGLIVMFNVIGPFLIQTVLHYNAVYFGYIALVMGLAFCIGNILNRHLVSHFRIYHLITFGLYGALAFSVVFLVLGLVYPVGLYNFIVPVFLVFLLLPFIFPNTMSVAMSLFPKMAGAASAMVGLILSGVTALSSMVASFLMSSTQLPMAVAFIVMSIICFFCYYCLMRRKLLSL
ncbi:MAG: multidrug effflux MFS transporter [Gammaproteobacteria bacterium]|nr:multidrug effflux MFS transporter [Gammaproteobacteria bacterium]